MNVLNSLIEPNIFEKIETAGIATPRQLLTLSVLDLKKVTNLTTKDILYVRNVVSNYYKPPSITCETLVKSQKIKKIAIGCKNIDNLLCGGFATGTITDLYGESGSGKTQVGITAAANSWPNKSVYICTEDLFPVKRLYQIKNSVSQNNNDGYGEHIFVEHLTESHELFSCIKVRLPKLLDKNEVSIIIIDSIAAPFRCESTNYIKRANDLREIAIILLGLAQKYNLAVVCINQVTSSFEESVNVLPSLGLAWSNLVTYRIWLKKMTGGINIVGWKHEEKDLQCNTCVRELSIMFAPDLPNLSTRFIITSNGLQSI